MAEFNVNKGIGRSPEFKGLKSQYLFIFAGGLLALFVIFVVMYMAGIDQWVCIGFGVVSASVLVWGTFRMNSKYGEWVFRFGLFGFGDPGGGLWMLILSMIVYGMAFDFFNISGSLFVEQEAKSSIRASAQGLFFMMTNGLGAIMGGYASGAVVDAFSVYADGRLVSREWMNIWLIFAAYALVIGILFALVFKYKHQQESKTN